MKRHSFSIAYTYISVPANELKSSGVNINHIDLTLYSEKFQSKIQTSKYMHKIRYLLNKIIVGIIATMPVT